MKRIGLPPTIERDDDGRLSLVWPYDDRGDVIMVTPGIIEMLVAVANDALDAARDAYGDDAAVGIATRCTRTGTEGLAR